MLNALNQRVLVALQTRGIAVPSQTMLADRFAIRVCITNHRITNEDLEAVAAIGAEMLPRRRRC